MPQLDITVFFFEILFIFAMFYFLAPWVGVGILTPITASSFVRWSLDVLATLSSVLSIFIFLARCLATALRPFVAFCSSLSELPSLFGFSSNSLAYFIRPASFLIAARIGDPLFFENYFNEVFLANFPNFVGDHDELWHAYSLGYTSFLFGEYDSDWKPMPGEWKSPPHELIWMYHHGYHTNLAYFLDFEMEKLLASQANSTSPTSPTSPVSQARQALNLACQCAFVTSEFWPFYSLNTEDVLGLAYHGSLFPTQIFAPTSSYGVKDFVYFLEDFLGYVFLLVGVLLSVAFLTLAERKIMASSQRRMGPNMVGFWGVLQPVADGLKLILKDADVPARATKTLFFIAALLPFVTAFTAWIIVPLSPAPLSDFSAGPLWVSAISSLGVYGIIFSGWASNSKYAFLGGLRSAAQVISYELVLSLIYLTVTVWNQTLNFYTIVEYQDRVCWNIFALFPCSIAFLIAMLAETNRTPFDLPEAESELVAGYNVEYRGVLFSLFFLAEYANMILMAVLFSILFLGGWMPLSVTLGSFSLTLLPGSVFFIIKIELILAFFILARAALPRVRYDQLMVLGWKYLIPFLFGFFFFISSVVFFIILA